MHTVLPPPPLLSTPLPAVPPWPHTHGRLRLLRWAGVAAAHLALFALLLVMGAHRPLQRQAQPLLLAVVGEPEPTHRPVPPPLRGAPALAPTPVLAEVPLVVVAEAPPARVVPDPAVRPLPPVAQPAAPVLAPAAPPPPAPPQRRQLAAGAVQYLVLPPVELPRLSRRLREHGVVWLRVLVDVQGLPVQVSVQRSSGFVRLDEQALWAMRQARFKPQTEDGRPIELEVIAPIEYPAT